MVLLPPQEVCMDIAKIRNVAFVGHGGVGKTSLVEAILFACGASTRLGRVDDGTTTTDFDPDEIKRKISLNTAVGFADHQGPRLNLIDARGYGDFVADARAGLRVAGAAVVVVDAVAGVQVQTEKVWKFANEYALPRAIVVNRVDRERADFSRPLESLQKGLKGRLVPMHLPIGAENSFVGVVDLIAMRARVLAGGKIKETDIPADLVESAKSYREKLTEAAAETDDDLFAKYLEEGSIGEPEMLAALRKAITSGDLVPILASSATRGIGIGPLLDLIVKEFPSPADAAEVEGTEPRTKAAAKRAADPKAPLSAVVFKTISDPHVGKLSVFRVYSGTLRSDSQVFNAARDSRERIGHLGWLSGKTQKPVESLGPGEIGVVAKLKDTLTGDTLSDEAHPVVLPGISFPEPAISFAIQPKTRGDEDKISIPLNFIPSVEKGVRDCMKRGILAGSPVVDLKVTLYDGSYHDVDSSDMAFQIAASMGLQKGFMEAKPCLLEPVMNVEVTAPSEGAGDVIGDLNGRRGRIVGMEPDGDVVAVRAQVPMSEMLTYESSLRSMTGGRGGYSIEVFHYQEGPGQLAEEGGAAHRAEKEKH